MSSIEIAAPAKINLTLDVKGKRPDGYHDLESVMHPVTLKDKVIINTAPWGISIQSNSLDIPLNEDNLAYKAANLILSRFIADRGVQIYLDKHIPVGAGLAGGSTDAAAVLRGINELYQLELGESDLMEMALEIGSDVPFCLTGKTCLARGRGEKLVPLSAEPNLNILLVKPPFQISTREVYHNFNFDKVDCWPDNTAFIEAWNGCDIISIAKGLTNVLETVCLPWFPEIKEIKMALIEMGALNALMSGSGPTVFGIFEDKQQERLAAEYFRTRYQEVYMVSSYMRGD